MIFQNFGFNQNYPVFVAAPVEGIQRLAVSSSLYAYYDIAFTASYSGSGLYGRINISFGRAISNTIPMTASSEWLPLFNGQFWNLRYGWTTTGAHFNTGSNTNTTYK